MKKSIRSVQNNLMPNFNGKAFSYGNTKIPESTLIVNLTLAQNCPSKQQGLCSCSGFCYALKSERIYKNYLNKNLQMEEFLNCASNENIIQLMEAYIQGSPEPITTIRLNKARDFINQEHVWQWSEIAKYFQEKYGITTYTYTHRPDLDFTGANFIVNGSVPGIQGAVRQFICLQKDEYDNWDRQKGQFMCRGNCRKCNLCSTNNLKGGTVYCRRH